MTYLNQLLILTTSISGVVLFFVNYKECKKYFSVYLEVFAIVGIVFLLNILFTYFYYEVNFTIVTIIDSIIGFVRNIILASLATYYYKDKLQLNPSPIILFKEKEDKKKYASIILLYFLVSILFAVLMIYISGNDIIIDRELGLTDSVVIIIGSFLESFSEEVFTRLFLLGLFLNIFGKNKSGISISLLLTTFIWMSNHFVNEIQILPAIIYFILGILWGYLMYKKGLESVIIVHGLYNSAAYLILGSIS